MMQQDLLLVGAGLMIWLILTVLLWRLAGRLTSGRGALRALIALIAFGMPLALFMFQSWLPTARHEAATAPGVDAPVASDGSAARDGSTGGTVRYRGKSRGISPLDEKAAERTPDKATAPAAPQAAAEAPQPPAPSAPVAPAPVPTAAPTASDRYDSVPVFYGTDRNRIEPSDGGQIDYGTERARRLELGQSWVTIPKALHAPGQIERPYEVVVLGIKVYAEKESPDKHFTIHSVTPLDHDAFVAAAKERLAGSKDFKDHALVFIHGYNTSFSDALFRSAQITYDLGFDGAPFLYSWPSQAGLAGYTYDQNSSEQAQPYLKQFLDIVMKETGAKNLTLIAHSMGNLPLLRILNDMQIAAAASNSGAKINQIILAAPDVDRDVFENLTAGLAVLSDNVTLYASANDRAMQASRQVGGAPRAGDVPEIGPVVTKNVDTVDISSISSDILALNHNDFAERSQLLQDIGKIMQQGLRPPPKREPLVEQVETGNGAYWKYPKAATPQ